MLGNKLIAYSKKKWKRMDFSKQYLYRVYKLRTLRSALGDKYLPFSLSRSSCKGKSYLSFIYYKKNDFSKKYHIENI